MLLPILLLVSAIASASNPTIPLLARRSGSSPFSLLVPRSQGCTVLPIQPTEFNGLVPCGLGSVLQSCTCCSGGAIGCISAIETCSANGLSCDCNPGLDCSDCPAQGLIECGNSCLPQGTVCCPGGTAGCPNTMQCGTDPNGEVACFPLNSASASSSSLEVDTSPAAASPTTAAPASPTGGDTSPAAASPTTAAASSPTGGDTSPAAASPTTAAASSSPTTTSDTGSQGPPATPTSSGRRDGIPIMLALTLLFVLINIH